MNRSFLLQMRQSGGDSITENFKGQNRDTLKGQNRDAKKKKQTKTKNKSSNESRISKALWQQEQHRKHDLLAVKE